MESRPTAIIEQEGWIRPMLVFMLTAVVLLAGLSAANVVVDPRAEFGTGIIRPVTVDDAYARAPLAEAYAGPWDVLVLGSSRAATLDPAAGSNVSIRAFNWATSAGTPSDMLAIYRLVLRDHPTPAKVILGVDPEWLIRTDVDHITSSRLAPLLPGSSPPNAPKILDAVSTLTEDYLWDTGRSLYYAHVAGYPTGRVSYSPSGVQTIMHGQTIEDTPEHHEFIRKDSEFRLGRFYNPNATMHPERLATLEALVDLVLASGAEAIILLPPVAPSADYGMWQHPLFDGTRDLITGWVRSRCSAGMYFLDATEVSSFGGDAHSFHDAWHHVGNNTLRLGQAALDAPACQAR